MQCPKCNTENRGSRQFCSSCGARLEAECPSCGFVNELADDFCGGCGIRLAEAGVEKSGQGNREPPEEGLSGDRRQLTIFFADLSGYTELSDALDAEELHGLVGLVFDAVDRIVEDHGGTVHRHVGDEVMALFGTPVSHTDDPIRAVRAAFETHRAMTALGAEQGRVLAVHIGIASGSVVIAGQGTENPQDAPEFAVTGVAANLAARLNNMAESGETIISNTVYRAVEEHVDCDALGETKVKGLAKPVLAWRAKALRSKRRKRPDSRFIGRRAESAQFIGALESCRDTRNGQVILVRGEAGMGKTRLVEEFEANAEERGFACHKGLIFDFGVGEGQDAIRILVCSLLAVPAGSDIPVREAAVAKALTGELCKPDQRVFLNDLLNLPQQAELRSLYDAMDNATRHQGKQTILAGLIQGLSNRQPRLLVVEDVHWADAAALSDLAQITTAVQDCPAVLVMTSRIEGDLLDQTWRGSTGGSPLLTVDIGPLREVEAVQFASQFTNANDEFARNCIERAGGNPLFLEQLFQSAEESGDEEVPATIQNLVLARMDQLPELDKRALQAASVIGQRFALDTLRALVDDPKYSCALLIEHHLVRPEEEDYLIAHALIQEGVYGSLLKAKRSRLHRFAAEWFTDRDPVLHAVHLDRADDPAAPRAYLQAAQFQASDYHYDQALQSVGRGLAIANDPADKFVLNSFRGRVLLDLGSIDDSIHAYELALEYAEGDVERCQAWIGLAAGMRIVDRYDDALEVLEQAEAAATKRDLPLELSRLHHLRGNLYFPLGKIERCCEQHDLSIIYARRGNSPEDEAQALSGLGDAEYARGRMITANKNFQSCVELCREHGFRRIEVANLPMVGATKLYLNEFQVCLENCRATIELASRIGHLRAELIGGIVSVQVLVEMFEVEDALEHMEKAEILIKRLGARRFEPIPLLYTAIISREGGRREEAYELCKRALAICRETGIGFYGPRVLAELALNCDDHDVQREALSEGEHILREGAVGHSHFHFYRGAMEMCLQSEEWESVERYATALEEYTRPEPLPWCDFFIARGRALAVNGRGEHDDSLVEELHRLNEIAARVGFKMAIPALEAALATTL